MLKEIVIAFQSWEQARRFIQAHHLIRWILIPGIVYALLFITGMVFFWQSADNVVSWISGQLGIETWLQKERSEWLSFFFVMTGMMLRLILVLFYFSLFKYAMLIIGSPLFTYLSEKTENIIEGKEKLIERAAIKKDAARGIRLALRNAGWQTVYLFALILLSLVPVAGWITPIIALFLECYYFGVSMLDYSLARNQFTLPQSIAFTGRHKGLAIGNGLLFYAMHVLLILAPAYAIIAGTLSVNTVKKN